MQLDLSVSRSRSRSISPTIVQSTSRSGSVSPTVVQSRSRSRSISPTMVEDSPVVLPMLEDSPVVSPRMVEDSPVGFARSTASVATTLFAAAFERYCLGVPGSSTLSSPSNHVQDHAVNQDRRVQYKLARTGADYDDILKHFKDILFRRPEHTRGFYVGACKSTPNERFYVKYSNNLKPHCDQYDCMVVVWRGTATDAIWVERKIIAHAKQIPGNVNYLPGGEGISASPEEGWVYVCLGSRNGEVLRRNTHRHKRYTDSDGILGFHLLGKRRKR